MARCQRHWGVKAKEVCRSFCSLPDDPQGVDPVQHTAKRPVSSVEGRVTANSKPFQPRANHQMLQQGIRHLRRAKPQTGSHSALPLLRSVKMTNSSSWKPPALYISVIKDLLQIAQHKLNACFGLQEGQQGRLARSAQTRQARVSVFIQPAAFFQSGLTADCAWWLHSQYLTAGRGDDSQRCVPISINNWLNSSLVTCKGCNAAVISHLPNQMVNPNILCNSCQTSSSSPPLR